MLSAKWAALVDSNSGGSTSEEDAMEERSETGIQLAGWCAESLRGNPELRAGHTGSFKDLAYWREYIPWYPDGCFGPYRRHADGYSRRELAADGATHVLGITLGCVGLVLLIWSSVNHQPPVEITVSVSVYGAALLFMLCFSAVFNGFAWTRHIWVLQLLDHIGILLLIAGTYAPVMTFACCPRCLSFVWALAFLSTAAKATRSRFDTIALHVPCFLLMGWACIFIWRDLLQVYTRWALCTCVAGGLFYSLGLIPWAINKLEFHNAIWHVCVLAGSACFFVVVYQEVSQPSNWKAVEDGICQGDLSGA